MSSGLYSHTTRGTGTVLTAAIYNSDHQNHITNQNPGMTGAYSDNVAQMQLATDPGDVGSEVPATHLGGELERLRFAISRIVGGPQWYSPPAFDLSGDAEIEDLVVTQSVILTGDLTPAQITADVNNYAPTGHADAIRFRVSSDAERRITGLAGGIAGRIVSFYNISEEIIVLSDEDGDSTDVNRFLLQDDVHILEGQSVVLQYDGTLDRWTPFGYVMGLNPIILGTLSVEGIILGDNLEMVGGYAEITEIAAPAAPAADKVRLYAKDVAGVSDLFYKRSDGSEVAVGGGFDQLGNITIGVATPNIDFGSLDLSIYSSVRLIWEAASTSAGGECLFRVSDDNGATWEPMSGFISSASSGDVVMRTDDEVSSSLMRIGRGASPAAGTADFFGMLEIFFPGIINRRKLARVEYGHTIGGSWDTGIARFMSDDIGAINAIRLVAGSSGNWDVGNFRLYGVK